ncbi:MAG: Hsp20/alpha crystallin family protein [Candidatus Atribacteria bacterium]|nr:Hsp20/alpha crystallin family protein [Candidatus Atribacteria bacterium]
MVRRDVPVKREERQVSPIRRLWDLFDLRSDLDELFDELMEAPFFTRPFLSSTFPAIDVAETENEVIIKAEIPGVDPKNLEVHVAEDNLNIKGEIKDEWEEKGVGYCRRERYCGAFERAVALPAKVKQEEVKAQYKDGVLTITLPKVEPSKPKTRKVEIEVAS